MKFVVNTSWLVGILLLYVFDVTDCKNFKSPSTTIPGSPQNLRNMSPFSKSELRDVRRIFNGTFEELKSLSDEEAHTLLAKNSYCMCQCCRPRISGPNTCRNMVRVPLPPRFVCPKTFCSKVLQNSCAKWNKNRCEKTCFCQKCKHRLSSSDGRCSGELESAAGCVCHGHETHEDICSPQTQGVANVWVFLTKAKMNKKFVSCAMGCFCTGCDHQTLSKVFSGLNIGNTCKVYSTIPKHCAAPCPTCPDYAAAYHAKKTLQEISVLQGSHG